MRVCVRVRPLTESEHLEGDEAWLLEGTSRITERDVGEKNRGARSFNFDRVFPAPSLNDAVYESMGREIVNDAMRGYHGAIVAYGQTATGKTHTMQGTPTSPGLIPLAIEEAFNHIAGASQEREYALRVSYLEVYNETIRDLLYDETLDDPGEPPSRWGGAALRPRDPKPRRPPPIRLVDDAKRGVTQLKGIREVSVASVGDVFDTIVEGEARRSVGETEFNSRSSRSHAILRLTIESSARRGAGDRRAADLRVLTSTLSFVDLAGSERCPEASAPARVKEGAYINKSLHALALVVSKLSAGVTKADHVPYRDSKLTRLLRPALGGKARVALVCTASLAASAAEETANTLKFAQRAKKVVQRGSDTRDSVVDTSSLLAHYRAQIDALKADLALANETNASLQRVESGSSLAPEAPAEDLSREDDAERLAAAAAAAAATEDERATLRGAVDHLERLILKSGERSPSPTALTTLAEQATDAERSPNPKAQFFSERKWRGAKGRRSMTLPPRALAADAPSPPREDLPAVAEDAADDADGAAPHRRARHHHGGAHHKHDKRAGAAKGKDDLLLRDLEGLLERGAALCASSTGPEREQHAALLESFRDDAQSRRASCPGTVEPLPPPPPPEEASSPPDAMVSSLLGIKQAIEKVLARGPEPPPEAAPATPGLRSPTKDDAAALEKRAAGLEADLQRAREDATFVLAQLDKAEAENERLQAELVRVTDILAAREAELLAAKGLDSPEDETF